MLEAERILIVDFTYNQAPAKEVAPLASTEGGPGQGHRGEIPEHFTSAQRRRGGHGVSPTGRDPHHHRLATCGVCSLVSD
jgi:hypothetical protein